MQDRKFGRLGRNVSEIGFGAWAIGGSWGEVSDTDARAALNAALEDGVTFIDTADVYGDGRSERLIAEVLKSRSTRPFVATKAGRRLNPHLASGYTLENLREFIDRSRRNLQVETLDLLQLHCPPTEVLYRPDVFAALEAMVAEGRIAAYGISVEKVEEGLKALEYPGVASVQIIYNIFRQRPARLFLREAQARGVGVIVRVPLASGLLTGKMTATTAFAADDHRAFNRNGEAFDRGETFAGVPYDVALKAVEEVRALLPQGVDMAQFALRWILMDSGVTTVIPGAKTAEQARANAQASELPAIGERELAALREVYEHSIAPHVHQVW